MARIQTALIVGGGIGGLATAIALRQRGIEATVVERAPAFAEVGAGISLWPNATRVLRDLGALGLLLERAGRINALHIPDASGRVLLRSPIPQPDAPALCAYRPDLIEALYAQLPEGTVRFGTTVASVHTDESGARLTFEDGSTAEADVVIGADGIHSAVRTFVTGRDEPPVYRGYPVWRGIAPLPESFVPGAISESWENGQRFGLLDVGGDRAYWYATANRPASEPSRDPKADVLRLFADWHDPIPEVVQATPEGAVMRSGTYDRPPLRGWSRGRAVLMGDAAHPTTPNLGQGGCMALEDAPALARCLADAASLPEAFRQFERARYRRTSRVTRESLWTGRLGQASGRLGSLRNALMARTPGAFYSRRQQWLFEYRA
ncbi:MAG: FAD-dependent monooxygenase [Bacteroidota bacterium]